MCELGGQSNPVSEYTADGYWDSLLPLPGKQQDFYVTIIYTLHTAGILARRRLLLITELARGLVGVGRSFARLIGF